ncbi:TPA: hemerythrin family protein [Campylobacter lari]|uniref:bacteriohemerythrin n=1 Tax=Campylobacter sp. W0066.2 TaxID=2735752 RepID=UPI0029877D65|nr:hemerythrin family protein [Campylobacter sp. W0066.2]HEG2581764.1 hemerythrin family protein [Campylobacter lari]
MVNFEWKQNYNINQIIIDNQHKALFNSVRKLQEQKEKNIDISIIRNTIKEMLHYAKQHCEDEENYMRSINFPMLEQHIQSHRRLKNMVQQIIEELNQRKFDFEILYNAAEEFLVHVLTEDLDILKHSKGLYDIQEEPYNIVEYSDIISSISESNGNDFNYVCACGDRIYKVKGNVHKSLYKRKTKIRCTMCRQPMVFLAHPSMEDIEFDILKKKVLG